MNRNDRREKGMPELLSPASCLEVLKTAVNYGADAVYIGGEAFGLRAKARNFSMEDMASGIAFAHERGARVYVTANILAHNEDLEPVREYFRQLRQIGPDALIISDPGIFVIAKEELPEMFPKKSARLLGVRPQEGKSVQPGKADFAGMGYAERAELYARNPELYRKLRGF